MITKDLLSIIDLTPEEIIALVDRAIEFKNGISPKPLIGCSVMVIFEKPSLRTRVSFDVGVQQLGGHSIYMSGEEIGLGVREPLSDIAKVLSRYIDCIVARVNDHASLEELAKYATVPVINALSDREHPCQIMADLQTIKEYKGGLKDQIVAFVGDGNNVARSLALALGSLGARFVIASPNDYGLDVATMEQARIRALKHGGEVLFTNDPREAVRGADVVYTDVWVSMGQESETERRLKAFSGYQVDEELMCLARPDALFMHDLPAHRGLEISDEMLEHPQSVVFDQAEKRLHAQKAVLADLFS